MGKKQSKTNNELTEPGLLRQYRNSKGLREWAQATGIRTMTLNHAELGKCRLNDRHLDTLIQNGHVDLACSLILLRWGDVLN